MRRLSVASDDDLGLCDFGQDEFHVSPLFGFPDGGSIVLVYIKIMVSGLHLRRNCLRFLMPFIYMLRIILIMFAPYARWMSGSL